ncbi:TRAP transporter small permease [Methylomarinum sp. Ch1-1]|uniref:TRAP transporter small permease protein n=1 Tax=Methylomarinum roseum TaxID=3067653 RepID=A0AAU7NT79_9GAMM|nr:TRAP transporter small permease [Methylomarinum sp. Ch1-1]MDP4519759.1 TRAP transporter small permease [Methylomarinum sp. Ch1-1]
MSLTALRNIRRWLLNGETFILVALFISLMLVAVTQIVMRNFFASGIIWAESFVRIAVLWIALIGAMIASRDGQHISIDVVVKKLPAGIRPIAQRLSALFTSAVCYVMTWHSLQFVLQEYRYGGIAFAAVPNWLCEAIIPIAFLIISLRYTISIVLPNSLSQ